jgi:beta-lactamase class A
MIGRVRIALVAGVMAMTACVSTQVTPSHIPTAAAQPKPAPRLVIPLPSLPQAPFPTALARAIHALWAGFDGKTGIAIARMDGNWVIHERGDELMPQQSVSKLWVAMAVMDAIDRGQLSLDQRVTLTRADLTVFNQPIAASIGEGSYTTTIADLLDRQMRRSDNTANDFLMRKVGGPQAIRNFIAAKGFGAIRFGPGEKYLQAKTAGLTWRPEYIDNQAFRDARTKLSDAARAAAMDAYIADPPDGASPIAIARALLRLKRGDILSPSSTRYLLNLMSTSITGPQRLHGGVPAGWQFAHKTGTGQEYKGRQAGFNDVAVLTAPDGTSYAVAVMIADTRTPLSKRFEFMQGISATVAAFHQQQ